jgi:hypothetical protein
MVGSGYMSSLEVPIKLVIEGGNIEPFLAEVISQEGSLRVGICQQCYLLVPSALVVKHTEAVHV